MEERSSDEAIRRACGGKNLHLNTGWDCWTLIRTLVNELLETLLQLSCVEVMKGGREEEECVGKGSSAEVK